MTNFCRDEWNVRNCSSSHVQVFRDRWTVQIGDGWNVRNWSIYCKVWIWILQNLNSLSCKRIDFVLAVKPTLMWLFCSSDYVCMFGCLVCMIHKIGLYTLPLRYEKEYAKVCVVSVVFGIHEISYAISLKIRLQALC